MRVLVLCDSPLKSKILAAYIDEWQMQPEFCSVPEEVVDRMLAAHTAGEPYQFVFVVHSASAQKITDIIDRSAAHPALSKTLFIVAAIFGSVLASRVLNKQGINAVITKPIFPDQLQDAFKILWNARQNDQPFSLVTRTMITQLQHGNSGRHEEALSFHGTRILVVEDILVNQVLMRKILEKLGCHIECVNNGRKAVEAVRGKEYDLIFMDCQMPDIDGFEATRLIRDYQSVESKHTIIVALTADAMTGDREKCLNAGMDDYLNKPYKPEQIAMMLKKWVSHK